MKLLKNHGKKISVMLIAIALMISPMLNVFAAEDQTCEKRFHYYFLLAEEAYIDHVETVKKDDNTEEKIISRSYSTEYEQYFGIKDADLNSRPGELFGSQFTPKLEKPFTKADGITAAKTVSATKSSDQYSASFYNYALDSAFKRTGKTEITNNWTIADWQRYAKMYTKGYKTAKSNPSSTDVYEVDDSSDDIYFIHYSWLDDRNQSSAAWFNSDETHALRTLFEDWSKYNYDLSSSEVQDVLNRLSAASYTVPSNVNIPLEAGAEYNTTFNSTIDRTLTNIDSLDRDNKDNTNFFKYAVATDKENIEDNYAWFFFPAMATVTFTATGDVCNTANIGDSTNTTITETSENNPKTGIVSYAIIGTLLVGAASAYIYARKNNKFNKV